MPTQHKIGFALESIFSGIAHLKESFPEREFTIDGRLVGDIGEVIAAMHYDIELDSTSQPNHDGTASNGSRVQVKATFKDHLTFKTVPQYYLGLKLYPDGSYEEIYNGPGQPIFDRYQHRAGIGQKLLSFPIKDLKVLSTMIPTNRRIPRVSVVKTRNNVEAGKNTAD